MPCCVAARSVAREFERVSEQLVLAPHGHLQHPAVSYAHSRSWHARRFVP